MSARPKITQSARTKIVATVGPACRTPASLTELALAGVDVFRLNMAHGTRAEHDEIVDSIRRISQDLAVPLGILVDLAGPKLRLGQLADDPLECHEGQIVRFVRGLRAERSGELVSPYKRLIDELQPGARVLLADASVELEVEKRTDQFAECRVVQGGLLRSRQGINLPGTLLSVEAIGEKDREAAVWAATREIDFVSLSFVRRPDEVRELRELLRVEGSTALVIAKIEKPEALAHLNAIVDAADGVMVARGDLGVEIEIAEVPMAQKRIVEACNRRGRPVIIATQMLASMESTRSPTRAEVTDVANAVLDGGDACMLSGETAIGSFPREAVQMMNRIALATERHYRGLPPPPTAAQPDHGVHEITQAVVHGATRIANQLDARLLAVATRSGATAMALCKQRLFTPVLVLSEHEATLRKMTLFWGMTPVRAAPVNDLVALKEFVADWGRQDGCVRPGDPVVIITGTGVMPGTHNAVEVYRA